MWVARDKDGTLNLYISKDPPFRMNREYDPNLDDRDYTGCWIGPNYRCKIVQLNEYLFSSLKWEDEPVEVDLIIKDELSETQKELKNVYHELLNLQTKEIRNLTQVFRGVQLEEVSNIIHDIEKKIHSKYEMIGDPSCSQNCRMVTIAHSSTQISDNSLREYIDNDKVVVTIYVRRNDFNTADILVSDLGEYN